MIFAAIAAFLLVFWVVGFLMPMNDAQLQLGVLAGLCAANLVAVIMLYYKKRK